MMDMFKNARDPQTLLAQVAGRNPAVKQAMEYVKASGGDPKAAFYKMAEEKGVDPDEILKQLKA